MATIQVNLYDGARQRFRPDRKVLVSLRDRQQKSTSVFKPANTVNFDGIVIDKGRPDRNDYAVLASSADCSQVGFFPVRASDGDPKVIDLMLRPRHGNPHFALATWDAIVKRTALHAFLAGDNEDTARGAFNTLKDTPPSMACLLNIATAIDLLPLDEKERLLPLFRRIELRPGTGLKTDTEGILQDRFFAWADPKIKTVLETHAAGDRRIFAHAPAVLHSGANLSYKEIRFGEANLQFTFHEGEPAPPGTDWLKLEVDMDCYQDVGAHILLEVIPNEFITRVFKPHLTDPAVIYALRWMAGRQAGEVAAASGGEPPRSLFDPLFTLEA